MSMNLNPQAQASLLEHQSLKFDIDKPLIGDGNYHFYCCRIVCSGAILAILKFIWGLFKNLAYYYRYCRSLGISG